MLITQPNNIIPNGYTKITEEETLHASMQMDFTLLHLHAGQMEKIHHITKESALLLIKGEVVFSWNDHHRQARRNSCFEEGPWALHVSKNVPIGLQAKQESELVLLQARNQNSFDPVFYTPEDCQSQAFGQGVWDGSAERTVREVFSARNAPYSQLVLGEVIALPGRWSSYPPHYHEQPEIYYFRFEHPQGFGLSLVGDQAFKSIHNSSLLIDGNLVHPQVAAPGYKMYYCWMIRHLGENIWNNRIITPEHRWLDETAPPTPEMKSA